VKDINNIEDWYRDELDKFNVSPDADGWESLSKKLDTSTPLTDETISEWYKKEVSKLEERPDYTVWEKLATKLDTTSVWDKLVVSLNKYDQFIWWRNTAFKGTAILLLLFGSYLAYNNYSSNNDKLLSDNTHQNSLATTTNIKVVTSKNALKSKKSSSILNDNNLNNKIKNNSTNTPITAAKNSNLIKTDNLNQAIYTAKKVITQKAKDSKNLYASSNKEIFYYPIQVTGLSNLKTENERTIFTEFDRHQLNERDISHLYSKGNFLVKKENDKIVFNNKRFSSYFMYGLYARRIYVGANAGFKKQGLITNIKKNTELANYNRSDMLDFGSNFGLTVGYIVSDKFNLETNFDINSTSGYKRTYSQEGFSYKENLNLSYSTINLLAKKINTKSTFDNKVYSTNLIAGIYAGWMRSATSDINGVSQKLDTYNSTDLGFKDG